MIQTTFFSSKLTLGRPNVRWQHDFTSFGLIGFEILLALFAGFGFISLGADGGSWILGGIAAGAIGFAVYRSLNHQLHHQQAAPNRNARKIGQILVGLTIGFSVQSQDFMPLAAQLPILVFLTVALLVSSGLIGLLYSRLEKTDLLSAVLSTVPGNIGVMASIAADYGRNTALVSLIQLMRFTTVILAIPALAQVSHSHSSAVLTALIENTASLDQPDLLLLALVLSLTTIAVRLGIKLKIPVAAFFCAILVGLTLNTLFSILPVTAELGFQMPIVCNVIGQILLGITIGEYWGMSPRLKGRTLALTVVPVGLTIAAAYALSQFATLITPWDWLTCLLVTAPGGSPEMILIALTLNHDVEIVTIGHLVRLVAINLMLPLLISGVSRLENTERVGAAKLETVLETVRE